MERILKDILIGNRASTSDSLPLVHTAPAYYIQKILQTGTVTPRPCDVFLNENLSYFFVGRPAYKSIGRDIQHWELPSSLIVEFDDPKPKRIYPFDSGAFRKGHIPKYATMMEIDDYRLEKIPDPSQKYIGTFFGNNKNYFMGESISKEKLLKRHGITPTEGSINALISLISGERISKELDERRSSIEYQFDKDVNLESGTVKATILPEIYLKDRKFIKEIEKAEIQIITYPRFPINTDHFYFALYERCLSFYEKKGFLNV